MVQSIQRSQLLKWLITTFINYAAYSVTSAVDIWLFTSCELTSSRIYELHCGQKYVDTCLWYFSILFYIPMLDNNNNHNHNNDDDTVKVGSDMEKLVAEYKSFTVLNV